MNIINDVASLPRGVPLYIFGAGEGGRIVRSEMERHGGLTLAGFIDSQKQGSIDGIEIWSPQTFFDRRPADAVVVIASQYWANIVDVLYENGIDDAINIYPLIKMKLADQHKPSSGRMYTPEEYWTEVNVTNHRILASACESENYLEWRNLQYLGYDELMPTAGHYGRVVLDYGCGPGHDLVGFALRSRTRRLIAMDVSATSLTEARHRLSLHGAEAEWTKISEKKAQLPLDDASIDVVHCSGVLHHTPDPVGIMKEFNRILKPGGHAQIMVYNHDSVFVHLYIAYQRQLLDQTFPDMSVKEAFQRSTDGPDCPISNCYRPDEFVAMCQEAGFDTTFSGSAVAMLEMKLLPLRFDALLDERLAPEHRRFLYALSFDSQGCPLYRGARAGIDACYRLIKA